MSVAAAAAREPDTPRDRRRQAALLLGLLLACAYACFASGAVGLPQETRLQVLLAALAIGASIAGFGGGSLRLGADRRGVWAVVLLGAFAAWCALSLLWSITPDRTWQEVNRALAYLLVVLLGLAVGASTPRAIERVAAGWLLVAVAVAAYALGGKALPGVNVPGLFDLNNTGAVSRLRAPLEYWNALGLVCTLAIPIALRFATDATQRPRVRLLALAALYELVVALAMTYSRGALLGLVAAMAVLTAFGGARLRGLAVLGAAFVAATPALGAAFTLTGLSTNNAPLGQRITDGRTFLAVFLVCGAALVVAGRVGLTAERRVRWTPRRDRAAWRFLAVGSAGVALLFSTGVAGADGGWRGALRDTADNFTKTAKDETFDPVRLASTNSGNRWSWWKEAAGGWAERPVLGWGAGSFPLVHKRFRTDDVPVQQPHSVPLQFLVETGIVGAVFALGAFGLLMAAALARIRTLAGRERDLGVALFAGGVAWLVHGVFDWDWSIPGVTVPALLLLAVVAGRPPRREVPTFADPESRGHVTRVVAVGAACLALATYAASAVLPAWSESTADDAAAMIDEDATEADLTEAAEKAELAARLDPLAVRPLFVGASIAQGRGRLLDARRLLLEATERSPEDPDVWFRLGGLALQLADRKGFRDATRRALELDPVNGTARALATRAEAFLTPASGSATAVGTTLPLPGTAPAAQTTTPPPATLPPGFP